MEEIKPVQINQAVLDYAGVTRMTLHSWCRKYTVDGKPLGILVGGRWKVYLARLKKFKEGGGERIF